MADNEEVQPQQPEEKTAPLDIGGLSEFFKEKSAEHDHKTKATADPEPDAAPVEKPAEPPTKEEPPPERKPDATEARVAALEERMRAATPAPVAPPPKETGEDPRMQQVRDLWWSDSDKARELHEQIILEKADKRIEERFAQREAEARANEFGAAAYGAAMAAAERLAKVKGVTVSEARSMIHGALSKLGEYVEQSGDRASMLNPENYLIAYELAHSVQIPREVATAEVPPPPVAADPPGSKRAAPPAPRGPARAPLSAEDDRSLSRLASSVGLSDDGLLRFKQKVAANR